MIEVLKQALDALETEVSIDWTNNDEFNASAEKMHDAITSLRQAIAKLESQESVAYLCENAVGHKYFRWKKPTSIYKPIALYTHPPQRTWVGLTDEEVNNAIKEKNITPLFTYRMIARTIEAKLKERNL